MLVSRSSLSTLVRSHGGSISDEIYTVKEQNHDLTARYSMDLGPIGANFFGGFNANQRDRKYVSGYGSGLTLPNFYNMSNAQSQFAYEGTTGRRLWVFTVKRSLTTLTGHT